MTPKAFGCQDSLKRGEAFVDIPVHEHIIILGPMTNLDGGSLKPGFDLRR